MARKIELELGGRWVENPKMYLPGVVAVVTLFDDLAPRACQALWDHLPIEGKTVHAYSIGQAWRCQKNYELLPPGEAENPPAATLEPGSLIHLNVNTPYEMEDGSHRLMKVFMVYGGTAEPPNPNISVLGKVDENLDELIKLSYRTLYEGSKNVTMKRK